MVEMISDLEPTFLFFRETPENASKIDGLASSLQKVETCLLLVALKRFPTALSTSVAAVESVMHSSGTPELRSGNNLKKKFAAAAQKYPSLRRFSAAELKELRDRRNTFEHLGFRPKDDGDSVRLLLDIAFPYLDECYKAIHSFGLLANLIEDVGRQWLIAEEARRAGTDVRYCLDAFAHFMRYYFDLSATSEFAHEFVGSNKHFELLLDRKATLEGTLSPEWVFDCPMCFWPEGLVCQLDSQKLEEKNVHVEIMVCANCSFVANRNAYPLINILLRDQIASQKEKILSAYGIKRF
jgi:hypothetical protein